jgi:TonB family protein
MSEPAGPPTGPAQPLPIPVAPASWPRRRWGWTIALAFAGQAALIFWLGERGPVAPHPPVQAPLVHVAGPALDALLAIDDPTLFARPHRRGFSAPAWLDAVLVPPRPPDWSEAPAWLALPASQLGASPDRLANANPLGAPRLLPGFEPEVAIPEPILPALLPAQSGLRLRDELAGRALLTPLDLPLWQHADVLTNTVVQVVVDARGWPRSVTLLSGSGLKQADDYAVAQARAARFEPARAPGQDESPLTNPVAGLAWGTLVFEWHTDPLPATNAPAGR